MLPPAVTPLYVDGDFTVATAISTPIFSQPFAGDNGEYVLTQAFQQFAANFAPLALNTVHPSFASYVLTSESPLQDIGAGIVTWMRTYCKVPATRSDGGCISYPFIGFTAQTTIVGSVSTTLAGRPRFTEVVNARIQHDYYLVGSGGTYTDQTLIPINIEQRYYVPYGNIAISSGTTTFTPLYAAGSTLAILTGNQTDYLNDNVTVSGVAFSAPQASVPSRSAYTAMMIAGSEIVAEPSKVVRWMGNIWDRQTVYILAR